MCIRIEAFNRGDEAADLHILPHLWFRNQWAWEDKRMPEPEITNCTQDGSLCLMADDTRMHSFVKPAV